MSSDGLLERVARGGQASWKPDCFAAVVTWNVFTPGWIVAGSVTTRFLLMLTATGCGDERRPPAPGAVAAIRGQAGRADERQAHRDGTGSSLVPCGLPVVDTGPAGPGRLPSSTLHPRTTECQ